MANIFRRSPSGRINPALLRRQTPSGASQLIANEFFEYNPIGEGPPVQVNIGGVWKEVSAISVNIGGVWKAMSTLSVNIGGVWKATV